MAKFCTKCGSMLVDGKCSNCDNVAEPPKNNINNAANTNQNNSNYGNVYQNNNDTKKTQFKEKAEAFWETVKNRMGIGSPEPQQGDAYEENKRIVPDCIAANDGEIPVKQYKVAKLRNRFMAITYEKAIGRIQVTNKRVIFRAPGKSIVGRKRVQQEFAIDEISGIESKREYTFNMWDFVVGALFAALGFGVMSILMNLISGDNFYYGANSVAGPIILDLLFGVAGCIPFFMIKKKWLIKLICLGCSLSSFSTAATLSRFVGQSFGETNFLVVVFYILLFVAAVFLVFSLIINSIQPSIVLIIKNKEARSAINIQRRKIGTRIKNDDKDLGYAEVLPEADIDIAIKEINAIIIDIQQLGDACIDKWKQN